MSKRKVMICKGDCGKATRTVSGYCRTCRELVAKRAMGVEVETQIKEAESFRASKLPPTPKLYGEWAICGDPHVPSHSTESIMRLCEDADILGIKKLLIAGDLIDNAAESGFARTRSKPDPIDSMNATMQVVKALEMVFDEIVIFPGNHEQWTEKRMAKLAKTEAGRLSLKKLALTLKQDNIEDVGKLATAYFKSFLESSKVTYHPFPEAEINDEWVVQHPGSYSRVPPASERNMIGVRRKSVCGAHSHHWAIAVDPSGVNIAFTMGHLSDPDAHRYRKAKPTAHPAWVPGYGFILRPDPEGNPKGELLPVACHDRWFSLPALAERLRG